MLTADLAQSLTSWIKEEVVYSGCKGVVFGMSGGIDSTVIAVLCRNAFPQTSLGLILPCHSDIKDKEHAELVAHCYSIPVKVIELDTVYEDSLKAVRFESNNAFALRTAEANLKPRMRMLTLYYHANVLNYLVVGSSNRCELYVGYFTKCGDGGVDIMPLANLVKKEVKELAVFLGIPQEIIDKPPTAGLWKGQTDEKEMGVTYDELDRYLLTGQAKANIKEKIESLSQKNSHKRNMPLVPPAIRRE